MAEQATEQHRLDELFKNPPEVRRESQQLQERLQKDARKSQEVAQRLRSLFPQPGSQMSEQDRQELGEMARKQKGLQQRAAELEQQMEQIGQRAPIFNDEASAQMQQAGEKMQNAQERLSGKDPGRGFGEQQGALQALQGLQQQMERAGQRGGKGGIPLPLRGSRSGRGTRPEKVELPDEDPNQAPREFRKEVMDAMKQGAPDRYKDQNKKYYEELVK
jgi:DNA repair exonuclease SbcCD ATPase subunit